MNDMPVYTIARVFNAPREVVFDAWADRDKMAQWSGPPGATLTVVSGTIEEGVTMLTRSDHPQMGTTYTLAVWREVKPNDRIVWEQSFANEQGEVIQTDFFPHWPPVLLTEVDFEDEVDGTRVTLRWTPIEGTQEEIDEFARQMAMMDLGWGGSFDKLEELLSG